METEKAIREYISNVIHLSLATSRDNKPWVCEVHYMYDDNLNLYFRSNSSRRHSIEIAENPHVSGNIVEQHGIGEKPRGVYFEGVAAKLTDVDDTHPAYIAYCERYGSRPEILVEAKTDKGGQFYKISVETFYLFDARESNPGQKYELPWGR